MKRGHRLHSDLWEFFVLAFSGVSKSFDDRPVLADISLSVPPASRTAVVGPNGSGKSTLLRLAAGLVTPDRGTVHAPAAGIGYVPQDYALAGGLSVDAYLRRRAGIAVIEDQLHRAEQAMAAGVDGALDTYSAALDRYLAADGYGFDERAERVLDQLGLPAPVRSRPLETLSGGEQVRVGLAGVLASRCALYLLDEPTNNLDTFALGLLSEFIASSDATVLVVSHDRAFLEATATDVVELDPQTHTAAQYGLPFVDYLEARERARAARYARSEAYHDEVARLRASATAQQAKAGRTSDRRPPRDNDKFARHFFAQRSSEQAGKAMKALERRLGRLEKPEEPQRQWELRLSLQSGDRSGTTVATLTDAVVTVGAFTLGPLSLDVSWRERIALQGHNGSGKSLLVDLLTGAHRPESGTVRTGAQVRPGLLRQSVLPEDATATGLSAFRGAVDATVADARTLLAKFNLGADHVLRPVSTYSPGERCRLGLAILMATGANWLLLDEPTNHLDLEATEELERALERFDGTLLVVSHDRVFLNRIGVTRRLELVDGHLVADTLGEVDAAV